MPIEHDVLPLRRGRMPRFEARVFYGALLVAAPSALALAALLGFGLPPAGLWWTVPLAVVVATLMLARWQYRRVVHPLYTYSGLVEALREGDYSLRGVTGGVLGDMVHDINALADRLHRERLEFEESAYLLGKTLAALDSAVFVFDQYRKLRLVNPAGQQLLAAEKHRLFGMGAAELGLEGFLDAAATSVVTHAFPGRRGRFEIRHAPLRSKGHGGSLLVINDVGRVLRQEERQAWQRLLRVLGHEFNNSLAPIRSMAETLAALVVREPLPEDWREDFRGGLEVIGNRAGALGRFLSGYSRLARLPEPRKRTIDLGELVAKVARLEQRLPVQLETGEALQVEADTDQLEQALINLVGNAVEASQANAGGVRVRWRADDGRACLEIEDDGPGPASENLFVPFFTTKPGGSGIGLALVRQIVEAHDGEVSLIRRGEGGGALARVWLPLAVAD